jgi:hypothetical protein
MYIFGGFIAGERTNQLIIYSFDEPCWSRVKPKGPQPSPRNGHSACIYKSFMYIFGGRDDDNNKLNDMWKFNIETQEWTEIPMTARDDDPSWIVPLERSGHSCDVYGQYMVIFGGFFDITKELNDLYLFDFITESWLPIFEEVSPSMMKSQAYNELSSSINLGISSHSAIGFHKPQMMQSAQETVLSTFDNPDPYHVRTSNSHRA